jgi:hypothetical protein
MYFLTMSNPVYSCNYMFVIVFNVNISLITSLYFNIQFMIT